MGDALNGEDIPAFSLIQLAESLKLIPVAAMRNATASPPSSVAKSLNDLPSSKMENEGCLSSLQGEEHDLPGVPGRFRIAQMSRILIRSSASSKDSLRASCVECIIWLDYALAYMRKSGKFLTSSSVKTTLEIPPCHKQERGFFYWDLRAFTTSSQS